VALALTYGTSHTLVRMRLASFRHALKDSFRLTWIVTGGLVGLVLAGGTIWVAAKGDHDVLVVVLGVWMLGWVVGPLFTGGGDETLRPEYFTMLPLPPRTLSTGLLVAALAGVAPIISLIALLSLVVSGGTVAAALVAVPALLLQLFCFILASRLAVAVYGVLLQVRAGAVIAALVNAFILAFTAQGWALIVAFVSTDVQGTMAKAARIAPSGWGFDAVQAAGRGDWSQVVGLLLALGVFAAAMLFAWSALLVRRTTASHANSRPRRLLTAKTPAGAAAAKEIRSWTRDLLYGHKAIFAIAYGLFFCMMPLAIGLKSMLPWAGPAAVVMAGSMSSNLYGADGTAFWTTLMTPGSARPDVRARQRAFLLVFGPSTLVITLVLTWWSGYYSAWPLVLSALPALLGGAAGLVVACSVYAAVPTTDAHKRSGNPLNSGENEGETMGIVYVMLVLTATTCAPALVVALYAGWWGVPVGILSGVLSWWYFGRVAARRLDRRGPELLTLLRHGRSPAEQAKKTAGFDALPKWRRTLAGFCLGFGAIPLFPQAVVPAIVKLTGNHDTKSWFLALYQDGPWQWVVIVVMAALGLSMYAFGGLTYYRAKKRAPGGSVAAVAG
jgi:ABC-2 type transport system permease protein